MNEKQINKLMNSLLLISVSLILLGAFFKLQHYPYGDLLLATGIWSSLVIGTVELIRLKMMIRALENDASKSN